jgi:regulator of RNase E activity RraA
VAATYGEVMTTTYKSFGAVGLITSGAGRDLEQVGALGFPCFCDGMISSHGYPQILDIHVAIHVGGLPVHAGDLIHGDGNGVTSIPEEIASEVVDACAEFVACEAIVLDYLNLNQGNVTQKGFVTARKELGAAISALGERVRQGR